MIDYGRARRTMLDTQIRPNDVTDAALLDAFLEVPRERFVPPGLETLAYLDRDLPLAPLSPSRSMMQPMALAKLLQAGTISPSDKVLVVGAGTGYSASVLAHLAKAVVALECDGAMVEAARANLRDQAGVTVEAGPLEKGFPSGAPFDVILVEGSVDLIPSHLFEQLAEGGRLLTVVNHGRVGRATIFLKTRGDIGERILFDIVVPPLDAFQKPRVFAF